MLASRSSTPVALSSQSGDDGFSQVYTRPPTPVGTTVGTQTLKTGWNVTVSADGKSYTTTPGAAAALVSGRLRSAAETFTAAKGTAFSVEQCGTDLASKVVIRRTAVPLDSRLSDDQKYRPVRSRY